VDAARKLLEDHVRRWPKQHVAWTAYYITLAQTEGSLDECLAVNGRAFIQLPYRIEMFDHYTTNLLQGFVVTGDDAFSRELRAVIGRYEGLLGEAPESLIVRSELAQLEGDDVVALGLANRAYLELAEMRPAKLLMKLGACYASIPGKQQLGEELLEEAARTGNDPATYLTLGVIAEARDPARAQACIAQARAMMSHEHMSSQRFEAMLATMREMHQAEVRIREAARAPRAPASPLWAGANGTASPR
jgi:hypothetical protein